jgi:thiamine biosynthesis lipoprotein
MLKTNLVKMLFVVFVLVLSTAVCGCASGGDAKAETLDEDSADIKQSTDFAMGTVINQTLYTDNDEIAPAVIRLLTQTENELLSWRVDESEIAQINTKAQNGEAATISYETRGYLDIALSIAKESDGAFDPTIGYLTRLWGFDEDKNVIPDDLEIQNIKEQMGYENIILQGDTVTMPADVSVDFGAIGKGIGCDEIKKMLDEKADVTGAIINLGGSSILTYGEKENGEDWKVAITNPTSPEDFLGTIQIHGDNQISTSGDYENYFEENGKRYYHILDPDTGYPADTNLHSVTIVSDTGAISDALSTACFVLGKENGRELIKKYDAEAIFVDNEKKVYVTDGLKDKFKILADDYTIQENW